MMKPVGKPDAGNLHVRFDERGGETEHVFTRHRALPRLCSRGCASNSNPTDRSYSGRSSSIRRPIRRRSCKKRVPGCQGMQPFTDPGSISLFYEQWKTKTIHFDPQVAAL